MGVDLPIRDNYRQKGEACTYIRAERLKGAERGYCPAKLSYHFLNPSKHHQFSYAHKYFINILFIPDISTAWIGRTFGNPNGELRWPADA